MKPAAARAQVSFEWLSALNTDDLTGIVALLDKVASTSGTNGYAKPLSQQQVAQLAARMRFGLTQGTLHQLVARTADSRAIVGIASLESTTQPTRKHVVEVHRAAIAPAYRAKFLLRGRAELLRKCREMGWEVIQIDVSERGPVVLWERMGFRIFGVVPDYARERGHKVDGYYMTLEVEAPRPANGKESRASS